MIQNSTTTCTGDASGTICLTTYAADPSSTAVTNGFTYGEIVISMFDFLILVSIMAVVFHLKFRKIKTKNI